MHIQAVAYRAVLIQIDNQRGWHCYRAVGEFCVLISACAHADGHIGAILFFALYKEPALKTFFPFLLALSLSGMLPLSFAPSALHSRYSTLPFKGSFTQKM
jgi:hypothetical protein